MQKIDYKSKMGWLPDKPDFRDYTRKHPKVNKMYAKISLPKEIPPNLDLRQYCSPIEDQGNLGSCTANAAVGMLEYFEIRSFKQFINLSRLFLYKVTRNLMQVTGDTGAEIRNTLGAMTMIGVPPEKYWPYDISKFDNEPTSLCYALSQNYKTTKYVRLDYANIQPAQLLTDIKTNIANGIPSIFGFSVYDSISQADKDGKIPYPISSENIVGGHAIMAVGYDDTLVINNSNDSDNKQGTSTTGALLIRNSWGDQWGDKGYGWLPYAYVNNGIAIDWWTILDQDWIDSDMFGY